MVIMVALDFAMYYFYDSRIQSAVEQGAIYSVDTKASLNAVAVRDYVAATSRLPNPVTVTITCNGTANCTSTSANCFCFSGATDTYKSAASCTATCGTGSIAGNQIRFNAVYPYTPALPSPLLEGLTIRDRAVVRLQ